MGSSCNCGEIRIRYRWTGEGGPWKATDMTFGTVGDARGFRDHIKRVMHLTHGREDESISLAVFRQVPGRSGWIFGGLI